MIPARVPPPPPGPITLPKLLLVEGDTPTHLCEALLRDLRLPTKSKFGIFAASETSRLSWSRSFKRRNSVRLQLRSALCEMRKKSPPSMREKRLRMLSWRLA